MHTTSCKVDFARDLSIILFHMNEAFNLEIDLGRKMLCYLTKKASHHFDGLSLVQRKLRQRPNASEFHCKSFF